MQYAMFQRFMNFRHVKESLIQQEVNKLLIKTISDVILNPWHFFLVYQDMYHVVFTTEYCIMVSVMLNLKEKASPSELEKKKEQKEVLDAIKAMLEPMAKALLIILKDIKDRRIPFEGRNKIRCDC